MGNPKRTYVSVAYTHGTADSRVRRHCETMVRRGWRVFQLGLGQANDPSVNRVNGVVYIRCLLHRYRGGNLLAYAWSYGVFLFWARRVLSRLRRDHSVAAVHANNIPNFVVWVANGARRRGARVILDIHDPVPELFLCKFAGLPGASLGAVVLRLEERAAARMADVVLCVNDVHLEVTERHLVPKDKLRVVLNAADGSFFPIGAPRVAEPFIAYHGTLTARMGLDVVLRSFNVLRERGLEIRAAFWGDGDVVDDLRRLRDRLGLGGIVEIPGRRVVLEELIPQLRTVGISLASMRRDVFTDIILPTKLLEVVRLGVPAVVTWTPTVARYFPDDSVYFLREFTPHGVASVLSDVITKPEEARERAARAQSLPIAMSWQEIEQDFANIVEGLANSADRHLVSA